MLICDGDTVGTWHTSVLLLGQKKKKGEAS
jgi:hypothetical protein